MRSLTACRGIARRCGVEWPAATSSSLVRWKSSLVTQFKDATKEEGSHSETFQQQASLGNEEFHADEFAASQVGRTVGTTSDTKDDILQHLQNLTNQPPHERISPGELSYFGKSKIPITSELHIITPEEETPVDTWPVFRMMDEDGRFRHDDSPPPSPIPNQDLEALRSYLVRQHPRYSSEFSESLLLCEAKNDYPDVPTRNALLRAYRNMIRLREMDGILLNAQRQGRISFYMTCTGEEAIHFGSASALELGDTVFAQYREAGLLMWRGFTLDQFTNQCFSNDLDLGRGRQMPVHYGSRALNYQTVSSPLGTQLPQAVGASYYMKMQKKRNVCVAFFGDGAASSIDFHSACNFAATLGTPTIFFCRNNGFAISTPTDEQYAGDGIVSRAPGYGMAAIRVDGNDLFAVHAAVLTAKTHALEHCAPVLIEAMTYRGGHHSTSDDSSRYRDESEVEGTHVDADPLKRLESFLYRIGWLSEEEKAHIRDTEKMAVLAAMDSAENRPRPPLDALFEDVYKVAPAQLQEQEAALYKHLSAEAKD